MKVKYNIYNPAGNITALVIGDEYNMEQRKIINNKIMETDLRIEQVGFISLVKRKLTMAGGEFCGNATRCAILHYDIGEGETITINDKKIVGGINRNNIWCEIPVEKYKFSIIDKGIYKVKLEGITIIVVKEKISKKYICTNLKEQAKNIIELYKLDNEEAVGVMFLETGNTFKVKPVVWVRNINTLFFENACGSGTIAISIVESILKNRSGKYQVLQPSGEFLNTEITLENGIITKAVLSGAIYKENQIKEITI